MTQGFGQITCCGSWSHATDLFYFFPPDRWLAAKERTIPLLENCDSMEDKQFTRYSSISEYLTSINGNYIISQSFQNLCMLSVSNAKSKNITESQ